MTLINITLRRFDPVTRIFSGNAMPGSLGLEIIHVREQTLEEHCPDIDLTELTKELYMGRPFKIARFNEEWVIGKERVERYGKDW